MPSGLVGALALVLVPEISHYNELKNQAELKKRIDGALNFAVAVSLIIIPAFVACGKEFCNFLYGNEQAGLYLEVFAFMMAPMSLNHICNSICNSLNKEYIGLRNYFFGAAALLLCVLILPRFIGVYALLAGYIANLVITATLNIICINKCVKISFKFLINALILLCLSVPVIFLGNNIQSIFNNINAPSVLSVLVMAVCMGFIVLAAVLFKVLDLSLIFKRQNKEKV